MRNKLGEIIIDLGSVTIDDNFKDGSAMDITSLLSKEIYEVIKNSNKQKHFYLTAIIDDANGEQIICKLLPLYISANDELQGIVEITSLGDGTLTTLIINYDTEHVYLTSC